jgi:glycine cleavage system H protein
MNFEVPDDRFYTDSHEWARPVDGSVRIGITDFAQDELGDIVFVELPGVGEAIEAGETFGLVESIKAVSDLYAPVDGEVRAVNDDLELAPEAVNDDPYGEGWLLEVQSDDDLESLLSPDEYREQTA